MDRSWERASLPSKYRPDDEEMERWSKRSDRKRADAGESRPSQRADPPNHRVAATLPGGHHHVPDLRAPPPTARATAIPGHCPAHAVHLDPTASSRTDAPPPASQPEPHHSDGRVLPRWIHTGSMHPPPPRPGPAPSANPVPDLAGIRSTRHHRRCSHHTTKEQQGTVAGLRRQTPPHAPAVVPPSPAAARRPRRQVVPRQPEPPRGEEEEAPPPPTPAGLRQAAAGGRGTGPEGYGFPRPLAGAERVVGLVSSGDSFSHARSFYQGVSFPAGGDDEG
nr:formin-like protein 3 [Aegilops tauschii subsp. strangulata]